ncbi:urease accessory protein UreD [Devosia sp. ZB163]|uniref:urease accessory protein UreD n=1 Tax=Devosia sp. ZB163 TaxID=3025938 RepID=UPI00235E6F42|nr:urease accessory protein UreD [Devosia sp. ZB163]MDC9826258.1 urease accessory protein UreD [Devosia sp. ZB163]
MKHVTIPQSDTAQLNLGFVARNGRTVLDRRLFRYPYVLMRTFSQPSLPVQEGLDDAAATLTHVVVQNSSGPVHDRDNLATNLRLGQGTSVRVTYQGATAVHRARSGNTSRERLAIALDSGSSLTYLPEARILFPDASHQQTTNIELSAGSSLLFTDSFTVHDPEGTTRPLRELDNTLTIRRDGEIVLLDRQHLVTPAFDRGFSAFGTILLIGHDEPNLSEIPHLYAARSRLPSNLGWSLRLAAPDLRPIRTAINLVA